MRRAACEWPPVLVLALTPDVKIARRLIAIAAGMPFGVAGTTNLLRIGRLATA